MSPEWHVTLSCALSFGVPIALGIRELLLLRRGPGSPDGEEVDPSPRLPITFAPPPMDAGPSLGDPAGEPETELPAVLMPLSRPTRLPAREKEREREKV